MAGTQEDDEQEKPLDPAVENVRRKLVRFIIVNLGILFIALMAVVVALVYRATRPSERAPSTVSELPMPAQGDFISGEIPLPQGARIVGQSLSGGVLSLHVQLGEAEEEAIFLYDVAGARLIGRFDIVGGR